MIKTDLDKYKNKEIETKKGYYLIKGKVTNLLKVLCVSDELNYSIITKECDFVLNIEKNEIKREYEILGKIKNMKVSEVELE